MVHRVHRVHRVQKVILVQRDIHQYEAWITGRQQTNRRSSTVCPLEEAEEAEQMVRTVDTIYLALTQVVI